MVLIEIFYHRKEFNQTAKQLNPEESFPSPIGKHFNQEKATYYRFNHC